MGMKLTLKELELAIPTIDLLESLLSRKSG